MTNSLETIIITSSMENTDLYNNFITQKQLNRKYFIYQNIKYNVVLGDDIKQLILHRKYVSQKMRHNRWVEKKESIRQQ